MRLPLITLTHMETGLQILMADGPTRVEFSRHLNGQHYEQLLAIVQSYTAGATSANLRDDLTLAAKRWGVSVVVTRSEPAGS